MTEQLLYITQVAGYQNGPAGVHRVLPQATTALGHFPIAYEYPTYLRHLSGGLSWVLGHDR
jgi:hypothetical protein